MGVLQHDMYQKAGPGRLSRGIRARGQCNGDRGDARGLVGGSGGCLGLGLWALIGVGLHAVLTGGGDGAEQVTMAAPMDGGLYAGE